MSDQKIKIEQAIRRGLQYLSEAQAPDGFFDTWLASDQNFDQYRKATTVFIPALILSCLNELKDYDDCEEIKTKLVKFLLTQKSKFWTFNYWRRDSSMTEERPYPDDLDDTFVSLEALHDYDPKIINGRVLSRAISILTALESAEGGPYTTWVVDPASAEQVWKDVDLAVNSNIANFLKKQDVELDNLRNMAERAIEKADFYSPYYPKSLSVIYFISRFYNGEKKSKLAEYLMGLPRNDLDVLEKALLILSLRNLGFDIGDLRNEIEELINAQRDGAWSACGFHLDLKKDGKEYYAGTPELTTAFVLVALESYKKSEWGEAVSSEEHIIDYPKIEQRIGERMEQRINQLPVELSARFSSAWQDMKQSRSYRQIIVLPELFKQTLPTWRGWLVGGRKLDDLAEMNLLGWLAYKIYDDFLDNEARVENLPTANYCLKEMTLLYVKATDDWRKWFSSKNKIDQRFKSIMNKLEDANTWEVRYCRARVENNIMQIPDQLPDYGDLSRLADRSLGHALGPLIIMYRVFSGGQSELLMRFFKHYIIARQLNDDAHDWEDDLRAGRLTPIGVALLSEWRRVKKTNKINFKQDWPWFQEYYWCHYISEVCRQMMYNVEEAKKALAEIKTVKNKQILTSLLRSAENSARVALREQKRTKEFIADYSAE